MINDMIIKESVSWGLTYNVRNVNKLTRLIRKREILGRYPVVDHYKIYACRYPGQKGPAKEEQTFLLSFAYNYDSYYDDHDFVNELHDIGLRFYKEPCTFRSKDAYKIIIYESMCPLDLILTFTSTVQFE